MPPVTMPRVVQRPTPNYTPTLIKHDLVIVHRTEGGYAGSVAWLCQPDVKASAHLVMKADGSEVTQLVPLQFKAWAQCAFNSAGVSLEIEGYTKNGFGEAGKPAAAIVAWLCRAYAIPPTWARGGAGRGVCQHHDLGVGGGGHVDCSGVGSPEWKAFLALVLDAYDALGSGPLPGFALHGLPNPAQTELPPVGAPEPSHEGSARNEVADPSSHAHPTSTGYPRGSVADMQRRLNWAGASLTVDGFAGSLTRKAIGSFQARHGLVPDGLAGPLTWAALNAS